MAFRLTPAIPKILSIFVLAALTLAGQSVDTDSADRARIIALGKIVLRDSAELPMDVDVTTLLTDPAGKQKRRTQSSVRLLFHGYILQEGKSSFESSTGPFNTGALRDSLSGDFAVVAAIGRLAPKKGEEGLLEIERDASGQSLLIRAPNGDCNQFEMLSRVPYPTKYCSSVEFHVVADSTGTLALERFTMDIARLPAAGRLASLGPVQVRKIRIEGNVQKAYLPTDPKPFFIPKQVVTRIETNKGALLLTNVYTLRHAPAAKK